MSESFAERLSRFSPDAPGLDRDALLFAAGRASVRPKRIWPMLAAILAGCQLLTMAVLWPRAAAPIVSVELTAGESEREIRPADTLTSGEWTVYALNQRILYLELEDRQPSAAAGSMAPAEPPLHAWPGSIPDDLN
jgi:hypothetical protein